MMSHRLSVSLSDGSFEDSQIMGNASPKKFSFFENLIRKNTTRKSSKSSLSWSNLFSKKSTTTTPKPSLEREEEVITKNTLSKEEEEMNQFMEELRLEGRSEAEIKLHLSYIHDGPSTCTNTVAPASPKKKSKNIVSQFFNEVQQAFKEVTFVNEPFDEDQQQDNLHNFTIDISSPFHDDMEEDIDMTYEELASLEPVYVGSKCINKLPSCKHDGTPLPGDQTKCPVCLCEFAEGEDLKSLPCVHFYHKDCIDAWLLVGHNCPLCKADVE